MAGIVAGCAVMDSNLPAWDTHLSPDKREDIKLSYSDTGDGKPILLIHGFGASSYSWRHISKSLALKHRVITVDLKGFGNSPKPRDDEYTVYEQSRLIRNFIVEQELDELAIIGHSFGGGVALVTAVYLSHSHPGLIKKLILMDNVAYRQKLPGFVEIIATPILGPLSVHLLPNQYQVRALLEEVYFNDDLVPDAAVEHYAKGLQQENAKYALITAARQLIPDDLDQFSENYKNLKIPTLIIWGKNDEIIPLKIGKRLHADMPNSSLKILNNAGHAIHEEEPARILPILHEFLETEAGL